MSFDNQSIGNSPLTTFTAASDTIAGVQYQRIKLVGGAENSTEAIEGTAANGLEVDVTRVQGTVTVGGTVSVSSSPTSATATKSAVSDTASDTLILASNASRKGAAVTNDSSAVLYLSLGTVAASTSSYTVQLGQGDYYEVPFGYTGEIRGIWASDPNAGAARVTELT